MNRSNPIQVAELMNEFSNILFEDINERIKSYGDVDLQIMFMNMKVIYKQFRFLV